MLSAALYVVNSLGERLDKALRKSDGGFLPTVLKLGTGLIQGTAVRNGPNVETPIEVDTSVIATKAYVASAVGGNVPVTGTATTGAGIAVDSATDDGTGKVKIEAASHPFETGDRVLVHGVGGVSGANVCTTVTKDGDDFFILDNSTFSGAYTSGGTVLRCEELLQVPAPNNKVTRFLLEVSALKSGTGYAQALLDVRIGISSGAVDANTSGVQFIGQPVDSALGVFGWLVSASADDGSGTPGKIKLTTGATHDVWTGDGVEVIGPTAALASGQWNATRNDSTHVTLQGSTYAAGDRFYPQIVHLALAARSKSIQVVWASTNGGTLTVYAVGHPTLAGVVWDGTAFARMTTT